MNRQTRWKHYTSIGQSGLVGGGYKKTKNLIVKNSINDTTLVQINFLSFSVIFYMNSCDSKHCLWDTYVMSVLC